MQRTLAIVKPDAVANKNVGEIVSRIEREGFRIVGMRLVNLSRREAEGFYAVHRDKPFFNDLTAFMSSGPAVVLCLEAEDAISKWRTVMGATNPENADEGTLRKQFATNIERNAVHGSDAPETAAVEIAYFFKGVELV
ncbi:MAG: nucleoside-diphosphate kinase [Acidobacteria bacterium]|nr:nucleoside-diphosphate kinase [Acidobacteriota bacterium]NIM63238.1 nucleoside-diphosphate kinase [Acidobacteriota bacterium]NIO61016.1 nucleoside-diphosphate kinase [Acidobacteriota bacterium]NIQ87525.1 nucleoside-diphosphate kinase [Acidobacteriota bacterium]NIT12653.1 nucleoside-diphosphate kinase [Acidobacteriota bacterium]